MRNVLKMQAKKSNQQTGNEFEEQVLDFFVELFERKGNFSCLMFCVHKNIFSYI